MRRLLFAIVFFFSIFYFLSPLPAQAQTKEFETTLAVTYLLRETGVVETQLAATITNLTTERLASSFEIALTSSSPKNVRAYELGRQLTVVQDQQNGTTILRVEFDKPVVGKDASRSFQLVFETDTLSTKTGEIWEVVLPKFLDTSRFDAFTLELRVPITVGDLAYVSPAPSAQTTTDTERVYSFARDLISEKGITAAFGNFQVFSFSLFYHLENPLYTGSDIEIAIPPDTTFQRVSYTTITPRPKRIEKDSDGNWIATYSLAPREKVDIEASGHVQLFADPVRSFVPSAEVLSQNTLPQSYWEVTDPRVQALATSLKTPEAIYNYVVQTLTYNYDRVNATAKRLGALGALSKPTDAICTEFTDLFVTLARAAGIPAREVNGYAYTDNVQLQPLSLVADVLHAWPEYWDSQKNAWIAVDPTWGNTTQGIDYFTKLDLRHVTFAIHGTHSERPYPAGSYKLSANPQKDVFVSLATMPEPTNPTLALSIEPQSTFALTNAHFLVHIRNDSQVALYNEPITVYFDSKKAHEFTVEFLPPFATTDIPIVSPVGFFGVDLPHEITVESAYSQTKIITTKESVVLLTYVSILIGIFIIVLGIWILFRRKK